MGRLLILIALLLIGIVGAYWLKKKIEEEGRGFLIKAALIGAAVILLLLAATGRVHWLGAILAALLAGLRSLAPLLLRHLPLTQIWRYFSGAGKTSTGNASTVKTDILSMQLDHDSGELTGEVLSGPFAGQSLGQMEPDQLRELLRFCLQQDQESAQLLQAYLQRRFGKSFDDGQAGAEQAHQPDTSGAMGEAEALAILGLEKGADKQAIVQAHRRLIQKLHPDRGGSEYLAAKLNQAKDILLAAL